ncbi:hypothetical protein HPB47_012696 [Ixodes persulcatus]|uniref:Uncharacterized protein n=1 Tax=Ixodes persulcatus TaxID=34615 RepID=A0AC60NSS2_IXOPE|nr:hypothetical protein HPB47_012696 [Ixodes persulcatus]
MLLALIAFPLHGCIGLWCAFIITASAKRSTMLLSKLMQPLFKAFKNDADGGFSSQMELQRRGEGKMYWKCYFNAVSCFRRK